MDLDRLPQILWPLAVAAVGIALAATAIVQLLKDLFPFRRWFQRRFLNRWFSERLNQGSKSIASAQLLAAEKDLIHLATGGDRDAFYDLETAQLCGQMNSAAQMALAYPQRHPDLLRFLAPEADEHDIDLVTQAPDSAGRESTNAPSQPSAAMDALLDARNRVTHHLQRSIDALQISMSFRWKFNLQILIYAICLVASFACVVAVKPSGRYNIVEALVIAVVAGFLSPAISDLVVAINRWRKP